MGHVKFYFILNASALKIFIASFMLYLYGSLVYKTAVCQYGLGDQKSMFTLHIQPHFASGKTSGRFKELKLRQRSELAPLLCQHY